MIPIHHNYIHEFAPMVVAISFLLFGFVIIFSPGLAVAGLMLLGDKVSGRQR